MKKLLITTLMLAIPFGVMGTTPRYQPISSSAWYKNMQYNLNHLTIPKYNYNIKVVIPNA